MQVGGQAGRKRGLSERREQKKQRRRISTEEGGGMNWNVRGKNGRRE
jgi:hypothetical protein